MEHPFRRKQKTAVIDGLLAFNFVLVLIQLWLLVTVLENLLGGDSQMAIPAALASVAILIVNVWMLRGIVHIEKSH